MSGVVSASTLTPLIDADAWVSGSNSPGNHTSFPNPTIANDSYSWQTNWGRGYSSYSFEEPLTLTAGSDAALSLQYTITTSTTNDCVMTLALVGGDSTDTIVSGMSYKSPLRYAVTNSNTNSGYTFGIGISYSITQG